ncbi:serine-threonine kinase receptor-associated protein-like [Galendromus occidentalis]|uniref:Serine-threonine kinase receptor-associated protein n=1 Tax=Galendromus occidentalis TaxID=34638 RepID=A0AAJ6QQJ4_9ACAR|nr:serine-threonine kinase receptor-associated protein-like [Galendromus occidentalis]XP_003745421.1 serine-threonine kinase receptor-associated protein-like [Galendromus occidentalis]
MASANLRQVVLTCSGHTRPVVDLCFARSQSGKCLLISACKDGKPMLRDGVTGDWIGTFEGHKGAVWSVHMDPSATLAATGSADFSAKIWDLSTGNEKLSLPHKHIVRAVELSPDGSQLTTGSADKIIRRFDLSAGDDKEAFTFDGHHGAVKYVRLLGDGKRLLSVGDDRSIRVWDFISGECIHTQQLPGIPQSLEISANGEQFVITMDRKVTFWSTVNYQMMREFELPCKMYAASLHSAGEFFVCGGDDFKMYKMNYETGEEIESFKGHFGPVHCCAFSSDGELYASGSEDGTVRLWQTIVGKTYGLWKYVDANGSDAAKAES